MPPETTYPTTRPNWLAETGSGAAPGGAPAPRPRPPGAAPPAGTAAWASRIRQQFIPAIIPSTPVVALGTLASPATLPTPANIVAIMSAVCAFYGIPCALGLTVLDHECPPARHRVPGLTRGFRHPDGLMQTIRAARTDVIPLIPRPLKLQLLQLPANDRTSNATLDRRLLQSEFRLRVAVQIAAGVQEIVIGLGKFNGYVALALIAYNAGAGNATFIATRGKTNSRAKLAAFRPPAAWEAACLFGAGLLHQPATAVIVQQGRWQCDANLATRGRSGWHKEIQVQDRSGRTLIAYQYLRSVRGCIPRVPPTEVCNAAIHKQRRPGTGALTCTPSRDGALDKLYDPTRLRPELQLAAAAFLQPIPQDHLPLKVENGRFVKVP
jgi:hypothetical protein